MIDEASIANKAKQQRIECPVWHSPLYVLSPAGIMCKCKSCRGRTTHVTSWEEVDRYRASLAAGEDKEG